MDQKLACSSHAQLGPLVPGSCGLVVKAALPRELADLVRNPIVLHTARLEV